MKDTDKEASKNIGKMLKEACDIMVEGAREIAKVYGVECLDNISGDEVPDDHISIGWHETKQIKGVTKVAYCANILSMVVFVKDGENGQRCFTIRNNTIRARSGIVGYFRLMHPEIPEEEFEAAEKKMFGGAKS